MRLLDENERNITNVERISARILDLMPGYHFLQEPRGFGWAPQRHLRATLGKNGHPKPIIIRNCWSDAGFQTEKFL